ncbi:MAG: type II secretion system ATPase GspE [Deltaproteobacteria bacterium]
MTPAGDSVLDNLLLRTGLTREQITEARQQAVSPGSLGASLEEVAGLPASRFTALLAERFGLPFATSLEDGQLDCSLLSRVSMQYCRRHQVLPMRVVSGCLKVATSDPATIGPLDDMRVLYGREIEPLVIPSTVLSENINRGFDRAASLASEVIAEIAIDDEEELALSSAELESTDLLEANDEAPVIRLVNSIIFNAVKAGASDIHLEPFERSVSVRLRIDGMLGEILNTSSRIHASLVSRIKVMAAMNIAERRLPQDGGIRTRVAGNDIDIRVSTIPTYFGERVVMRLLDRNAALLGLEELGFGGLNLKALRHLIHQSHGIVLVTGPTGSGKTTSLYAALSEINSAEKNIITIEDPVEYQLHGIGQIQVNPKIGLGFAAGLRSVLRQDPDIIMVGEIRDGETAKIAIQAAMTGHLVFSTLHTNDSFSAVTRLLDMGIEPFLVSSSVTAILAQRLVRLLCPACSRPVAAMQSGLAELGLGYLLGDNDGLRCEGDGCQDCRGSGFSGRTAIAEVLVVDDDIRRLIMQRADSATLRETALARGMTTIRSDGAAKVRAGLTSVAEVLRVTADDGD